MAIVVKKWIYILKKDDYSSFFACSILLSFNLLISLSTYAQLIKHITESSSLSNKLICSSSIISAPSILSVIICDVIPG